MTTSASLRVRRSDMAILFQFIPEFFASQPEPEPSRPVGEPYIIQGTHRAYMGADSPQVAWIRDESGRHDLTQYDDIHVEIKRDTRDRPELAVPATGTAEGKLEFTITAEGAKRRLRAGPYTLFAISDGQVIYTGLLEVVS